MLFFCVDAARETAVNFVARLRERGLLMLDTGPTTIRAVTHLDVTADDVDKAVEILRDVARSAAR
jgi:threonine aldolase